MPPHYLYAGTAPPPALVSDFNKDGKADMSVTASRSGTVSVLLNDG